MKKRNTFDIFTFVAKYVVKHGLDIKNAELIVDFLIELAKVEAKAEKRRVRK